MKIVKISILFVAIYFVNILMYGQDPLWILKQSYEKCQSIDQGYYEMTKYKKYMTDKDTVKSSFQCYFKKLHNDSIYSSAFHYKGFMGDKLWSEQLYTGDDYVQIFHSDSTAIIMSKSTWANDIALYKGQLTFYSPLITKYSYPIQHDSDFISDEYRFKYMGEQTINNSACYHINVSRVPVLDSVSMVTVFSIVNDYWIKKEDFIPLQYTVVYGLLLNGDTMYQYERQILDKFDKNGLQDEGILTLSSIPSYFTTEDYVPYKTEAVLPLDTLAPDWELQSLSNETVSLKELRGQVILIDFFYKACYPCMRALPTLQALNEKYKDKGFRVIGIDPRDQLKDDIGGFLSRQGITYTVLLGGKDVAKKYKVPAYPTMYLIDREGKVIFTQVGYGKGVDEKLDDVIKRSLKIN